MAPDLLHVGISADIKLSLLQIIMPSLRQNRVPVDYPDLHKIYQTIVLMCTHVARKRLCFLS